MARVTPARAEVMTASDVQRAIVRIAHEIVERNHGTEGLALVGLQRGGTWIAEALAGAIAGIDAARPVPCGALDVSLHRDDIGLRPVSIGAISHIPFDLTAATVVLVDDVLFTGRTVRAALEALQPWGRPRRVALAVIVDRGHRELPIQPDYCGRVVPTSRQERIELCLQTIDGEEGVFLVRP